MKTITFDKLIAFSIEQYMSKKLKWDETNVLCTSTHLLTKIELHIVGPVY